MKKIPATRYNKTENTKIELLIERKISQLLAKKLSAMNGDFKKLYLQMSKNNFNRAFKEINLFNQQDLLSPHNPQNFKSNYNYLLNDFTKMLMRGIFKNF